MTSILQVSLLGAFAGLTIFLGLPVAVLQNLSPRKKGLLNAFAIGILVFLIVDVLSFAWSAVENAFLSKMPFGDAMLDLLMMFGGLAVGLLGLTWYGNRYMNGAHIRTAVDEPIVVGSRKRHELQLLHQVYSYRLSMMIAIGIGAHNFSEGLAIGQSYASGAISLATVLVIGFAAHNATEGFGIAAPLTGISVKPSNRFLVLVGLVGGGPTVIGTVLGSLWTSTLAVIFFLSTAGGALVYVTLLMYSAGRRQTTNNVLMIGLFIGALAGFLTDLLVTLGGA